jgi:hypothetical protein
MVELKKASELLEEGEAEELERLVEHIKPKLMTLRSIKKKTKLLYEAKVKEEEEFSALVDSNDIDKIKKYLGISEDEDL